MQIIAIFRDLPLQPGGVTHRIRHDKPALNDGCNHLCQLLCGHLQYGRARLPSFFKDAAWQKNYVVPLSIF